MICCSSLLQILRDYVTQKCRSHACICVNNVYFYRSIRYCCELKLETASSASALTTATRCISQDGVHPANVETTQSSLNYSAHFDLTQQLLSYYHFIILYRYNIISIDNTYYITSLEVGNIYSNAFTGQRSMSSCFCFWLKYKRTQEAANIRYLVTPLDTELTASSSKNGQIRRSLQASETFYDVSYHIVSCHMLNINCTGNSLLMGSMARSCKLWVASPFLI